ncbi:uncharacterized protein PAC_19950 [Phialocephala subalpina]|uniref:Uncharacterized protein n=1 Tax=Phialocephala subalpina TaxID=576137 RepID=A0A1L7XYG5_9HELO|nr:uncharacterized protein PAC_19950 [Phialocephala subalpina]
MTENLLTPAQRRTIIVSLKWHLYVPVAWMIILSPHFHIRKPSYHIHTIRGAKPRFFAGFAIPIILLLLADILLSGFLLLWDNNDDSSNYENFALRCLVFSIWAAWRAAQTLTISLSSQSFDFILCTIDRKVFIVVAKSTFAWTEDG